MSTYRTKQEATAAGLAAKKLLPNRGAGWALEVWENIGWHYDLERGLISIQESDHGDQGKQFWALVTDDPDSLGTGSVRWHEGHAVYYNTPAEALEAAKAMV